MLVLKSLVGLHRTMPPHAKSWLIGKDSDAGRDWGQEEKGTTENEMAGWHHWLDGRESQWTLGVGDAQGGLACCDSWGRKESDTTQRLIWSDLPFPSPGDLLEPGIKPTSPAWQADSLSPTHQESLVFSLTHHKPISPSIALGPPHLHMWDSLGMEAPFYSHSCFH